MEVVDTSIRFYEAEAAWAAQQWSRHGRRGVGGGGAVMPEVDTAWEKQGAADRWDRVVSGREERRVRSAGAAGPNVGPLRKKRGTEKKQRADAGAGTGHGASGWANRRNRERETKLFPPFFLIFKPILKCKFKSI